MTVDPDRFKSAIIEVLSKRAASRCSNPDCAAITHGPAVDNNGSISVGEAAHIYGAKPGSARYAPNMTAAERSSITNAIWLCRICHKIVDSDEVQFPAELLFEWRREHEKAVAERLGKTGDLLRRKITEGQLVGFENETYLARQIVIDKPEGWEYRLTAELLRSKFSHILSRWHSLDQGLYTKTVTTLAGEHALLWFQSRLTEATNLAAALGGVINNELPDSWGLPGQPGCPAKILRACNLLQEAAEHLLRFEENVKFTVQPACFEELASLFAGIARDVFMEVYRLPDEIAKIFNSEPLGGTHEIRIVLKLPEGWENKVDAALAHAGKMLFA